MDRDSMNEVILRIFDHCKDFEDSDYVTSVAVALGSFSSVSEHNSERIYSAADVVKLLTFLHDLHFDGFNKCKPDFKQG